MIPAAIRKPMARLVAIVDAKAISKSGSDCTLSSSGIGFLHQLESQEAATGTKR